MEEIKKEDNKKSNAAIILLAIILALAIIGIVFWLIFQFLMPSTKLKPLPQISYNQTYCQQDSDCVLIPAHKNCCHVCGQEAVRIKDKDSTISERQKLCPFTDQLCPIYKCPNYDYKAVCEQNKCVTKKELRNVNDNSNTNIIVSLDKNIYTQGEAVNITIKNNLNSDVMVANISVEYLEIMAGRMGNDVWKTVDRDIQCACTALCDLAVIVIERNKNQSFVWDQKTDQIIIADNPIGAKLPDSMSCERATIGTYRIKLSYLGSKGSGDVTLDAYSSKFDITNDTLSNNNINIPNDNTNVNINSAASSTGQYKIIGSYTSPGESSFIEKIGNNVFMTDISEGLLAIDVSDPVKPKLLGKLKIGNGGAYAVAIHNNFPNVSATSPFGRYVLVSGYASTEVSMVDVNNLSALKITESSNTKRSVQDVVLVGDYAYLAIDGPEVEILKLRRNTFDAKEITSVGFINLRAGSHAIGIAANELGNVLVVAEGEKGLGIYNLTNSSSPSLKLNISDIGYVNTVAISGNNVFTGIGNNVKIFDVNTQKEIGTVEVAGVWGLKVKDNTLYVASGEEGVKIFDVSGINNPKQIAIIDTPGRARDLVIDGDYIYVADDRDDLQIIEKQ